MMKKMMMNFYFSSFFIEYIFIDFSSVTIIITIYFKIFIMIATIIRVKSIITTIIIVIIIGLTIIIIIIVVINIFKAKRFPISIIIINWSLVSLMVLFER